MIAPYFFELFNASLLELAIFHFLLLLLVDFVLPGHSLLLFLFFLALIDSYFLRVNKSLGYDFFFVVEVRSFPVICQFWLIALFIEYAFKCFKLNNVIFGESNEDVL